MGPASWIFFKDPSCYGSKTGRGEGGFRTVNKRSAVRLDSRWDRELVRASTCQRLLSFDREREEITRVISRGNYLISFLFLVLVGFGFSSSSSSISQISS